MLRVILIKSWKQHPTKPISKAIQIGRTRHVGYCWRSRNALISDVLLWTPSQRSASVRPTRTYLQQLCTDAGYCLEILPDALDDRDEW